MNLRANYSKRIRLSLAFSIVAMTVCAQSIWNAEHLEQVKKSLNQPAYSATYQNLLKQADKALNAHHLSVMMKDKTPPSGDKHDYLSQARYFWPDPTKPDGKPYISRDGVSNPELDKLDRNRLGEMANNVTTLALAWYFSGKEQYALKATKQIRVWFLDKKTCMNPHLKYAQVAPGHNNDLGRCYGVIDTYSLVEMLDAVQLLEKSRSFTSKDSEQLKKWFGQLLDWILTSEQGKEEASRPNNHSTAYDAQAIAFALYTGNHKVAERILREVPEKRVFKQIEPGGKQPEELRRTLAFGYSEFNLQHLIDIAAMGEKAHVPILSVSSADGRSIYKAADFLKPYLGKGVKEWPYKQISEWNSKQQELCKDLYRLYLLDSTRTDYLKAYQQFRKKNSKELFNLLFLKEKDAL